MSVPIKLRTVVGKSEIHVSLKTTGALVARERVRLESLKIDRMLAEASGDISPINGLGAFFAPVACLSIAKPSISFLGLVERSMALPERAKLTDKGKLEYRVTFRLQLQVVIGLLRIKQMGDKMKRYCLIFAVFPLFAHFANASSPSAQKVSLNKPTLVNLDSIPADINDKLHLDDSMYLVAALRDGKNRDYYLIKRGSLQHGRMIEAYSLIENTASESRKFWTRVFEMDGQSGGCGENVERTQAINVKRGLISNEISQLPANGTILGGLRMPLVIMNCENRSEAKEVISITVDDSIHIEEF